LEAGLGFGVILDTVHFYSTEVGEVGEVVDFYKGVDFILMTPTSVLYLSVLYRVNTRPFFFDVLPCFF